MLNATKYLNAPAAFVERTLIRYEVDPHGCWLYTGLLTHDRYSRASYRVPAPERRTENLSVHVLAYVTRYGMIPEGMQLDHVCHDPESCDPALCVHRRCINPDHLALVSPRTNILRSSSFSAVNARTETCSEGHTFDTVTASGQRACKRCRAAATARYRASMTPEELEAHLARRRARRRKAG